MLISVLIIMIVLTACGYSPRKDDVVDDYGGIKNLDVFYQFIENVEQGKEGNLRIVNYTDEGDPVLHDIDYDGNEFISTHDFSRDKFSTGKKSTSTCENLNIIIKEETEIYELTDCDESDIKITLLIIGNHGHAY